MQCPLKGKISWTKARLTECGGGGIGDDDDDEKRSASQEGRLETVVSGRLLVEVRVSENESETQKGAVWLFFFLSFLAWKVEDYEGGGPGPGRKQASSSQLWMLVR